MSKKLMAQVCLMLVGVAMPTAVFAQSGIAGVVRDTTGAVLPGVTVEASSPVLIEKVRTVTTDDQGQYKIIDLRPGTYVATFSLPGFATVRREGIELPASFTANVNAELRLGALEETVTVSGTNPLVDIQNVVQTKVVTAELVSSIPTARTYQTFAQLIPGAGIDSSIRPAPQDVGGTSGERQRVMLHGSRPNDFSHTLDGLNGLSVLNSAGSTTFVTVNPGEVQEFSYELGALSAETEKGGPKVNIIPKEGGNRFSGFLFGAFANGAMQSDNLTSKLRAQGLTSGNPLDSVSDINPAVGGPVLRDKLWFFASARQNTMGLFVAGMYYNATPTAFSYTPDLSQQAIDDLWMRNASTRITWQAASKHKLSLYAYRNQQCQCHVGIGEVTAPEASTARTYKYAQIVTGTWSSPLTNRLLLQAGALINRFNVAANPQPGITPDIVSARELSTGLVFRAAPTYAPTTKHDIESYRAALSYVTGSHAFKVGMTLLRGQRDSRTEANGDYNITLLNGVPRSVTVYSTPYNNIENLNANLGIYGQDQWTLKRLTLNLGVRFDQLHASVPDQQVPAARLVPARNFAAVPDVPNWKDLSPRLGLSYDLFGTGRTALKVSVSRYVLGELVDFARANNPLITSVNSTTRTWTDTNRNFLPDCDLSSPVVNGECGALANASFGQVNIVTRYDDAIKKGFGVRGYNWETIAGVQHELARGLSVNAAYFRRSYGNFFATDNVLVAPSDYDPYCVTAPIDGRLPGGGGYEVCGLYDINPARFGRVSNLITEAKAYGKQTEVFNGVDLTTNARFGGGAMLQGGVSVGRTEKNECSVVDSPQVLRFCNVKPPFQPQIKFMGSYPLPWGFRAAGSFQTVPGPQITATYTATSAQILPSLGRNLAQGANGTANIELIEPGTMFGDRLYQVDVRLTKILQVRRVRVQANVDLYNALNASPVLVINRTYGSAWQQPTYILPGRLLKLSAELAF